MSDDEAAEKAIAQLNGHEVGGRALTVNEARPIERKEFNSRGFGSRGRSGGGGGGGGNRGRGGRY